MLTTPDRDRRFLAQARCAADSVVARQFLVFVLVGIGSVALSYSVYLGMLRIAPYTVAFTVSFLIALIYTALVHFKVVFVRRLTIFAFGAYSAYFALYFLGNLSALALLIDGAGVASWLAPLLLVPFAVPANFVGTRWITQRFGGTCR